MNGSHNRRPALAMVAALAATMSATAQETPIIPTFPNAAVNRLWDDQGDLRSTYARNGDEIMITVRRMAGHAVEGGWAGICVTNNTPVSLQNFTHATAQIEASVPVVMDIKIERTRFQDGTILLTDHGTIGAGRKTMSWNLRNSEEVVGGGTLAETRRMCFYVLADNFPARLDQVVIKVSHVRFDRRGTT